MWPTPSGLELSEVRLYCERVVKASAAASSCLATIGDSYKTTLDACIMDIQVVLDINHSILYSSKINTVILSGSIIQNTTTRISRPRVYCHVGRLVTKFAII